MSLRDEILARVEQLRCLAGFQKRYLLLTLSQYGENAESLAVLEVYERFIATARRKLSRFAAWRHVLRLAGGRVVSYPPTPCVSCWPTIKSRTTSLPPVRYTIWDEDRVLMSINMANCFGQPFCGIRRSCSRKN